MADPTKQEIAQVFKRLRTVGPNKVQLGSVEYNMLSQHVRRLVDDVLDMGRASIRISHHNTYVFHAVFKGIEAYFVSTCVYT